ncbi:MAG: nucleoside triphosphate pyrophosphatase [Lautropia sp.]|nr:nucleoside triphosphate pyrophosphatase [Lautropia sp.]
MIYLASRSPRRLELLRQIGIEPRLLLDEDEARAEALEAVQPGESPTTYVERVTRAKAAAARARLQALASTDAHHWPLLPLLAADTTVAIGGTILGKPADADDARRILGALSGRSHRVLTSVVVISASGRKQWQRTQVSRVRFMRLRAADIEAYVASGEAFGKAGAYGIQGAAARFVRKIDGSYSGIMGLPLHESALLLHKAGWRPA